MKKVFAVFALSSFVAACGGSDGGDPSLGTVSITSPADGSTINGPNVTVQVSVSGFEIRPAAEGIVPGTGHHHFYLDTDLTPADQPVPTIPPNVIHKGDATSEHTFENVAPGEHRIIAVVADGIHVPLQPWVVDTVTFTVR